MDALMVTFGDEIKDVDEETFDLFSQDLPSHSLGMVDARADTVELSIAGRDFEVKQSPGILQSQREGGTTGAAIWQASVRFAEWMGWSKNPLFEQEILNESSVVLELGAGISGFLPCIISPKVSRVIATDQTYILKTLQDNIAVSARPLKSQARSKTKRISDKECRPRTNIDVFALDWETDDIRSTLSSHGLEQGVDLVLACDCVFNYALIDPFVETCADVCRLRASALAGQKEGNPTMCLVAQQLRQPEVFEQWLAAFVRHFRAWRVPDALLCKDLRAGSGFVVHVGILQPL